MCEPSKPTVASAVSPLQQPQELKIHSGRVPNSESLKQEHRAPKTRLASNKPKPKPTVTPNPQPGFPTTWYGWIPKRNHDHHRTPKRKPFSIRGTACSYALDNTQSRRQQPDNSQYCVDTLKAVNFIARPVSLAGPPALVERRLIFFHVYVSVHVCIGVM